MCSEFCQMLFLFLVYLLKNTHTCIVGGVMKPCISKMLNVLESQETWLP